MADDVRVSWCADAARAPKLAAFFVANVGPEYISHSELQGARALSPIEWHPGLLDQVRQEIEGRLQDTRNNPPAATSCPILVAEEDGAVVALAFITFAGKAPVPFAIVEDLVVASTSRSRGVGKAVMNWIATEARTRGMSRLFLESGKGNHHAHKFFEREGFATCSIVMMRSLDRP